MILQRPTRASLVRAALGLGFTALAGCATTEMPMQGSAAPANDFAQSRCTGFADETAVTDILTGRSVESVTPLYLSSNSKANVTRLLGAVLTIRPAPGETAEWLDRALECHSARVLAGSAGETASDPFVSLGSTPQIAVRSAGDGFRIEVSSPVSLEARDILSRAHGLQITPMGVTAQQGKLGAL